MQFGTCIYIGILISFFVMIMYFLFIIMFFSNHGRLAFSCYITRWQSSPVQHNSLFACYNHFFSTVSDLCFSGRFARPSLDVPRLATFSFPFSSRLVIFSFPKGWLSPPRLHGWPSVVIILRHFILFYIFNVI